MNQGQIANLRLLWFQNSDMAIIWMLGWELWQGMSVVVLLVVASGKGSSIVECLMLALPLADSSFCRLKSVV
jgi:hypothetical protein